MLFNFRLYFRHISTFEFIDVVLDFLCSFAELKAVTVSARTQAAIVWSSGHSVKEIIKLLNKLKKQRMVNKWSNRKSFGKARSGRPFLLTNCAGNVIKKATEV